MHSRHVLPVHRRRGREHVDVWFARDAGLHFLRRHLHVLLLEQVELPGCPVLRHEPSSQGMGHE